jgi:hypothetical protein
MLFKESEEHRGDGGRKSGKVGEKPEAKGHKSE